MTWPTSQPLPAADLEHSYQGVGPLWEELRGKRLFITGGTGFVGKWLLETLMEADRRLGLDTSVVALSRNPGRFAGEAPHLASWSGLEIRRGDVRDFAFPQERFHFAIHAATDVVAASAPLDIFDTCITGTRRVLDFAAASGVGDFLLLSSGAVYGRQPPQMEHVPESYGGAPNPLLPGSGYGEGKRASEWLASAYGASGAIRPKIARCFAFVGPHLPLDKHFAIGNFIGDTMVGRPIHIKGDGTAFRSYLHAADLAVWLWTILIRARPLTAFNVGSDEAVSIAELARKVANVLRPGLPITVASEALAGIPAERYIPSITAAAEELGLRVLIGLDDAIKRTARWHAQLAYD